MVAHLVGCGEGATIGGAVGGQLLVVLFAKGSHVKGNTSGKAAITRGPVEFEGSLKDGTVRLKSAVIGDELKSGEEREPGERVGGHIFAKTEGDGKRRAVWQLVRGPVSDDSGEETMLGFGGGEIGRVSNNAVQADRVKGVVTVVEAEFGNEFRFARDNPKVEVEVADVGTTAGVEEAAKFHRVGRVWQQTDVPVDIRETHVNVQRHRRRAIGIAGAGGEAANADGQVCNVGVL